MPRQERKNPICQFRRNLFLQENMVSPFGGLELANRAIETFDRWCPRLALLRLVRSD